MITRNVVSAIVLSSTLVFTGCGANKASVDSYAPAAAKNTANQTAPAADNAALKSEVEQYRKFVIEQCDLFVKQTGRFVAAIKAGDLAKSQALDAPARIYYERIEPIAEALGDLDPDIDARDLR